MDMQRNWGRCFLALTPSLVDSVSVVGVNARNNP